MALVNGGYLHCRDMKKILVNSSLKVTKRKIGSSHLKNSGERSRGPSWPSCLGIMLLFGSRMGSFVQMNDQTAENMENREHNLLLLYHNAFIIVAL